MKSIETATLKRCLDVTDCSGVFGFEHVELVGWKAACLDSVGIRVDD